VYRMVGKVAFKYPQQLYPRTYRAHKIRVN
jgi:hypothetical protein